MRQYNHKADGTKEAIKKLTDKERLLLLWMIADYMKGNVLYRDAPKKLAAVFIDLVPVASKFMDR